jgi:hypothetical protein
VSDDEARKIVDQKLAVFEAWFEAWYKRASVPDLCQTLGTTAELLKNPECSPEIVKSLIRTMALRLAVLVQNENFITGDAK